MQNISNWTEGLSLLWGIALISSALMILTQPNLRQSALTIFQNTKNRLTKSTTNNFIRREWKQKRNKHKTC